MYLCFENEGVIDEKTWRTFGVSVKENKNPIGFFGTGLKYAIAIILRHGGEVIITTGEDLTKHTHRFTREPATVRGESFDFVAHNGEFLSFTTELGKNWEPWMAYRELYSNCLDENGRVKRRKRLVGKDGHTRIYVKCPEILKAHNNKGHYFVTGKPDFVGAEVDIWLRPSDCVFYRGIRAHTFNKPSGFTYNIKAPLDLTEDRTIKYYFYITSLIETALVSLKKKEHLDQLAAVLRSRGEYIERGLEFPTGQHCYSKQFVDYMLERYREDPLSIPPALSHHLLKVNPTVGFNQAELDPMDSVRLQKVLRFLAELGFDASEYKIRVVESLGGEVLALAHPNSREIVLSKRVFDQGTKQLASTLMEEILHLRDGYADNSRAMQTFLFDKVISLGERILNEPL